MWSGNAGSFIPSLASLRNSTLNTAGVSPPSGPICNRSKLAVFRGTSVTPFGVFKLGIQTVAFSKCT